MVHSISNNFTAGSIALCIFNNILVSAMIQHICMQHGIGYRMAYIRKAGVMLCTYKVVYRSITIINFTVLFVIHSIDQINSNSLSILTQA